MSRVTRLPRPSLTDAQQPKVGRCPKCGRTDVPVGGPVDGHFILQPHSPKPGGVVVCSGTNTSIMMSRTSP